MHRDPDAIRRRPVIVHNRDWLGRTDTGNAPASVAADAEVEETARAIQAALHRRGIDAPIWTVCDDVGDLPDRLLAQGATAVVNLVESLGGRGEREPEVPRALEAAGIPYTGNRPQALENAQHKDRARELLHAAGAPVPRGWVVAGPADLPLIPAEAFPLFVKPARVDGSIGIDQASRVTDTGALRARLAFLAAGLPGPFLVEEYLPGPEINVSIFPDPDAPDLPVTTIDFSKFGPDLAPIVTYAAKWDEASPEYACSSERAEGRLDAALLATCRDLARQAFRALGGTSYGRVDLRLDAAGTPRVMDVNTNTDVHPDSGFVRSLRLEGIAYDDLALSLLDGAHLEASARATGR